MSHHLPSPRLSRIVPLALAAATVIVGCAVEEETTDRADFEAEQERAPQALRTRDNGDGTWSYELPADFDPEARIQGALITWRYEEQATFSNEPTFGGERSFVVPEDESVDPLDQLMQMRRVDREGRVWVVDSIDQDAWADVLARHPDENEGDEAVLPLRAEPRDDDYVPGEVVTWTPSSWTHSDCVPGGGVFTPNELHVWEGDSRHLIYSGHTDRQKTAVRVTVNGSARCSAVVLTQDEILTAAHCVSDDHGNPIAINTVSVCRDDVWGCVDAEDIDYPGSYGGDGDFADDWAIIELEETFSAAGLGTAEDMDLSSASDNTLDALTNVHNLAFPQFLPGCVESSGTVLAHNREMEPIAGITSKRLKLKIDGSPGHSGSPFYYCPAGNNNLCSTGDKGFVIGVFAGYNSVSKRMVGPKSASFRSAALAFIND